MDRRAALQKRIEDNPNIDTVRKAAKLRELYAMPAERVATAYLNEFGTITSEPPEIKERPTKYVLIGGLLGVPIGGILWLMASLVV